MYICAESAVKSQLTNCGCDLAMHCFVPLSPTLSAEHSFCVFLLGCL